MTKQQQINTTIPVDLVVRVKSEIPKHGLTMRSFTTLAFEAALELLATGAQIVQARAKEAEAAAPAPKVKQSRQSGLKSGWLAKRHDDCPGWIIARPDLEVVKCPTCQRFAADHAARGHVKKLWQARKLPFNTQSFWLGWGMHPRDVKTAERLWKEDAASVTAYQAGKRK